MNVWHPLPPPQMIPVFLVNSIAFKAGFQAGCYASLGFVAAFLAVILMAFFASRPLLRRALPGASLALLLCVCTLPSRADTLPSSVDVSKATMAQYNGRYALSQGHYVLAGQVTEYLYSYTTSQGFVHWGFGNNLSGGNAVDFASIGDVTANPSPVGLAYNSYQNGPGPTVTVASPPSVPCTSGYPSSVSVYLVDAPSPCAYFAASQGFNSSLAPLLLSVLGVLMVILAIWLGHESIMSIFKRLVTGMTGGN